MLDSHHKVRDLYMVGRSVALNNGKIARLSKDIICDNVPCPFCE